MPFTVDPSKVQQGLSEAAAIPAGLRAYLFHGCSASIRMTQICAPTAKSLASYNAVTPARDWIVTHRSPIWDPA